MLSLSSRNEGDGFDNQNLSIPLPIPDEEKNLFSHFLLVSQKVLWRPSKNLLGHQKEGLLLYPLLRLSLYKQNLTILLWRFNSIFKCSNRNPLNPSRPNLGRREKIKLNFYFHFLWCLKRFYEGLKDLHKTFWGTTKKCENKNLT